MTTSTEIYGAVDGQTLLCLSFMLWPAVKYAGRISMLSLTNIIQETELDGSVVIL
jgi:hypothetical protein